MSIRIAYGGRLIGRASMDDSNRKSDEFLDENEGLISYVEKGERDRVDDSVQNSESELREIFEHTAVGVYRTTPDGRILMANPALVRMLGFSTFEELAHRNLEESGFEPAYSRELFKQHIEKEGKVVGLESVWTTRQGKCLVIIENARVVRDRDHKILYYEGTAEDITDRKKAEDELRRHRDRLEEMVVERTGELEKSNEELQSEIAERKQAVEALRESETRLRSIFRAASVGIGLVSDRVLLNVNDRVCEMTGYSCDELVGENARILYPTDEDYEYVGREKYEQIRKRGTGTVETRWRRKDGRVIDVLLSSTPLDPENLSAGVTFTALDITERKQAEEALRKSEEHYRMLAETINDGLSQLDENGKYVYVNKRCGEIFGYSPKEMIGRHWTEFHEPDTQEIIKRQLAKRRKGVAEPYEAVNTRRDGKRIHLRISPQPIFDEDGKFKGSLSILTDITELKKAEAKAREHQSELAHVWRVNTMGEMASGLAHELNQPLCAIMNYANACLRMMKTQTDITEELTDPIEQIASQADRAGEIIKRIRALVAKRKPHTSVVDMNCVVKEVVELEKAEAGNKGITVRTKLAENLPQVMADAVEIEEVILNLVRNAFDAMSDPVAERREVTIATRLTKGNMVEVCVQDTGKGFAALGRQIFDSFFTTKPEGLGIGLSISRTIIELHGGKLWAEQNPDCGASFRFTLPVKRD